MAAYRRKVAGVMTPRRARLKANAIKAHNARFLGAVSAIGTPPMRQSDAREAKLAHEDRRVRGVTRKGVRNKRLKGAAQVAVFDVGKWIKVPAGGIGRVKAARKKAGFF